MVFIPRDKDLEVKDDFKINVKKTLSSHQTIDAIELDGEVYGWVVSEEAPVRILMVGQVDNTQDHLEKLQQLANKHIQVGRYNLENPELTIEQQAITNSYNAVYIADVSGFTTDDIMLLYMKVKSQSIILLYNLDNKINQITGLDLKSTLAK